MFKLLIIRPDGQEVEQDFEGDQTIIGRHEKSDLRLFDGHGFQNHCIISKEGKRLISRTLTVATAHG